MLLRLSLNWHLMKLFSIRILTLYSLKTDLHYLQNVKCQHYCNGLKYFDFVQAFQLLHFHLFKQKIVFGYLPFEVFYSKAIFPLIKLQLFKVKMLYAFSLLHILLIKFHSLQLLLWFPHYFELLSNWHEFYFEFILQKIQTLESLMSIRIDSQLALHIKWCLFLNFLLMKFIKF